MAIEFKREEPPKLTNDNLPARVYYGLAEAAEIIGCTADALIHYGATDRIELLAPISKRVVVCPKNYATGEIDDSFFWTPILFRLPSQSCIEIELLGSTAVSTFSICYEMSGRFVLPWSPYDPKDPDSEDERKEARLWRFIFTSRSTDEAVEEKITSSQLLMFAKEIQRFKTSPASLAEQRPSTSEGSRREEKKNQNRSNKLAFLNQAFMKHWANAIPEDPQTHPKNAAVVSWLMEHGKYTATLAEKAATIIRPEWATVGRPTEK